MAIIYATLIVKGKKTYAQVPEKIKPQVKQVLIDLECEELWCICTSINRL